MQWILKNTMQQAGAPPTYSTLYHSHAHYLLDRNKILLENIETSLHAGLADMSPVCIPIRQVRAGSQVVICKIIYYYTRLFKYNFYLGGTN